MKSERIVIVGASHAGVAVVETLRRHGFGGKVTMISDEPVPLCSPTALPYLIGEREKQKKSLRPERFFEHIEVVNGRATEVDPHRGAVRMGFGKTIRYDRLVIATGASPAVPCEVPPKAPVYTIRRLRDLIPIEERLRKSRRVLIIGGGLIGLHIAQTFLEKGKDVRVIELADQLLPGLVPPRLGARLAELFRAKGVGLSFGSPVESIVDREVVLKGGERVGFDLAILATGVRANMHLAQGMGLAVDRGILVNEWMETNVANVFACGDVAEYRDFFDGGYRLNPNVLNAAEQGALVALRLLGIGEPHPGLIPANIFSCFGMTLFSAGRIATVPGDRLYEDEGEEGKVFKRLIFKDGRLEGAVFFNTHADGGIYYRLMKQRADIGGYAEKILHDPLFAGKALAGKDAVP